MTETVQDFTDEIMKVSKQSMYSLTFAEAQSFAMAIWPSYDAELRKNRVLRHNMGKIHKITLDSGLVGTDSRITNINYISRASVSEDDVLE